MSVFTALKRAGGSEVEQALCLAMCEVINTPHSLAVSIAVRHSDFVAYKELGLPDPRSYLDRELNSLLEKHLPRSVGGVRMSPLDFKGPKAFREDRCVSRMLVKSEGLPTGIDTAKVAMEKFRSIEECNKIRSTTPLSFPWLSELSHEVNHLLEGDGTSERFLNKEALDGLLEAGRFAPGNSAGMGLQTLPSQKLRLTATCGPELRTAAPLIKGAVWEMENPGVTIVPAVTISTVPKTAWTDRTVSSEPLLNMFMQLGLATLIEKRLRLFGVDIRDQSRNQNLAKRARDLKLATIDLESASSWFTERNLENILPVDLLHLIDLLRPKAWKSSEGDRDSQGREETPLYNWCPMGTGYTFTLMTLYFLALIRTCVPRGALSFCGVYGDDIIVPQAYAGVLVERLEKLGFKVNHQKSFLSGEFFESCGAEYFSGSHVTPFYTRTGSIGTSKEQQTPIVKNVQLANKLRRWAYDPQTDTCDSRWRFIWQCLLQGVPVKYKPPVPYTLGDCGLTVSLEETDLVREPKYLAYGWEDVYSLKVWRVSPVEETRLDPFPYLYKLKMAARTQEESSAYFRPDFKSRKIVTNESAFRTSTFSRGAEPVKGLFGLPVLKRTVTYWPSGYTWDLPNIR